MPDGTYPFMQERHPLYEMTFGLAPPRAQLEQKALAGNSLAQFFVGTLEDPGLHFHPTIPADAKKAEWSYKQAADQGVDVAAVNLGILLLHDQEGGVSKDFSEARRLFERAAPTTPIGTRELGVMKRNGWGEPMDSTGGTAMIRTAAERGDASAQRMIAAAYETSKAGLPHDPAEAVAWLRKAAAQGDARSQRQLRMHIKIGDGVTADPAAALDWFRKAAAQGDAEAQKEVDAATTPAPKP